VQENLLALKVSNDFYIWHRLQVPIPTKMFQIIVVQLFNSTETYKFFFTAATLDGATPLLNAIVNLPRDGRK